MINVESENSSASNLQNCSSFFSFCSSLSSTKARSLSVASVSTNNKSNNKINKSRCENNKDKNIKTSVNINDKTDSTKDKANHISQSDNDHHHHHHSCTKCGGPIIIFDDLAQNTDFLCSTAFSLERSSSTIFEGSSSAFDFSSSSPSSATQKVRNSSNDSQEEDMRSEAVSLQSASSFPICSSVAPTSCLSVASCVSSSLMAFSTLASFCSSLHASSRSTSSSLLDINNSERKKLVSSVVSLEPHFNIFDSFVIVAPADASKFCFSVSSSQKFNARNLHPSAQAREMSSIASPYQIDLHTSVCRTEKMLAYINKDTNVLKQPLCVDCMDLIMEAIVKETEEIQAECAIYENALHNLKRQIGCSYPKETCCSGEKQNNKSFNIDKNSGSNNFLCVRYESNSCLLDAEMPNKQTYGVSGKSTSTHCSITPKLEESEKQTSQTSKREESSRNDFEEDEDLTLLEKEERSLIEQIERIEKLNKKKMLEKEKINEEIKNLKIKENICWMEFAKHQKELVQHEEELAATNSAILYASEQLNRLKKINVINDTFYISCDGYFGIINGFRLGRLSAFNVSWDEINAAWGEVCLLFDVLLRKLNITLTEFHVVPRGCYSVIINKSDKTQYELYGGEGGFSRFFSARRFDQAMTNFLACVLELISHLERIQNDKGKKIEIPFKISGDKVEAFSIRFQFNQEERWTKALKFLLIDMKWIVAYVENVFD